MAFILNTLWISALPALAQTPTIDLPIELPCGYAVAKAIRAWDQKPQSWKRELSLNPVVVLYKAPTQEVGTWILLSHYTSEYVSITRATPATSLTILYNVNQQCLPRVELEQIPEAQDKVPPQFFTDQNLKGILEESRKQGTSGFVYVWSPKMALSIRGAVELKKAAKEMKLKPVFLADPLSPEAEVKTTATNYGIDLPSQHRLGSSELMQRGALIHFPTLLLFSKGVLLPKILPGYVGDQKYREYIFESLKESSQESGE
ncbi:hypothetical protein K2X30_08630 [bacterium]|nr:hypothetical protein [bacterium]